ncbi:MAG: hypothetical protein ACE5FH_00625, partial [Candidatus Zixiibacteriota bacterium]
MCKGRMSLAIMMMATIAMLSGCGSDDDTTNGPTTRPGGGVDGRLYVLNQGDNTMYIYDTQTLKRVDSIDTHVAMPHYIEFSPDGGRFYITTLIDVLGSGDAFIGKFDAADNSFIDSTIVPVAFQPSAIAISADGLFGYICNFSNSTDPTQIHKYNLADLTKIASLQAGAFTHDLKITSDGSLVIACNRFSDNLTLVDARADTVAFVDIDPDSAYAPTGDPKYGPFGVAIDHRDSLAFIACMDGLQVRVLDIKERRVVDSVDIPVVQQGLIWGPTLMAVHPDNDLVFVTTRFGNSIVAFRLSTKQTWDIPVGTVGPFGITISDDGSRVYAACVGRPDEHG